jgi:hypothetical protein
MSKKSSHKRKGVSLKAHREQKEFARVINLHVQRIRARQAIRARVWLAIIRALVVAFLLVAGACLFAWWVGR